MSAEIPGQISTAELERLLEESQRRCMELTIIIGDIEQLRTSEGDSVTILCDNPEANYSKDQCAVEVCGDWTDWNTRRFWAATWPEALHSAANASRTHNGLED